MEQSTKLPKLAIVVPCFNEEEVINDTIEKLIILLNSLVDENRIADSSFIFCVDDGSSDKTPQLLKSAHEKYNGRVKYVKFSKNFGNQSAILAGLKEVYKKTDADCAVTIDADLQQDETKISTFIEKMKEGYEIVAGIKKNRGKEPFYKKITGTLFYKMMNFLGVKIAQNHSEYRLLTRYAISQLLEYKESSIFLRGLLAELGLRTAHVDFYVKAREKGVSKFSFGKLLTLGFCGLVSHTTKPLTLIFIAGLLVTLACFLILSVAVVLEFTTPHGLKNVHFFEVWNTFLSGIQILCLGIMGQYIGQILAEAKKRPQYLIEEERL